MIKRTYLALCLSTKEVRWPFENISFYCLSDPKYYPRVQSSERIEYLASKWNQCHEAGLAHYPDATHIVNVGHQYLRQTSALKRLIQRYNELDCEIILAGNVWGKREDRLIPYKSTYDTWAYPDLAGLRWRRGPPRGLIQVDSVGMPCIYPVQAWRTHPFHNPRNMDDGIWYNQFCRDSGLPVFVDLSIAFYRSKLDSDIVHVALGKRVKIAFGIRKRLRAKLRRYRGVTSPTHPHL